MGLKLLSDIKRRKVIQGVIAYAVVGWLILQLAIALESSLELPSYVDRYVTIAVIAGFPVAILVSWFFDISLGGVKAIEATSPTPYAVAEAAPIVEKKPATKNSIAVLPFVDMSPDKDQGYLGDGVAEEILNALVQVTPLNVSGRTSSFSFKNKDVDIKHIGESLSVAHVLEGSIRKHGDRVRITAQLIKTDDGFHVWSETYDGDLKDIFDLQDEIAKAIVKALEVMLEVEQVRLVNKVTSSPEAYDLFLRGRKLANKQDGKGVLTGAIEYLEQAVDLDPEFGQAWAFLALANFWVLEHTRAPNWKQNIKVGKQAARRALELEPTNYFSQLAMYFVEVTAGRFGDAIDRVQKAYMLEPNRQIAKFTWGSALAAIGLSKEGDALMSDIVELDPRAGSLLGTIAYPSWAMDDLGRVKNVLLSAFELGNLTTATAYAFFLSQNDPKAGVNYFNVNFDGMGPMVTKSPARNRIFRFIYAQAVYGRKKWATILLRPIVGKVMMGDRVPPSSTAVFNTVYMSDPKRYFKMMRTKPNPYLVGGLMLLWLPMPQSKAIRRHKDFPTFAQDIGLVRAWQTYGWPKWVTPKPGTDGSNGQFTVV